MYVIGAPEREEGKKPKGIMAKNFLSFMTTVNSHIQAAQQSPSRIKTSEKHTRNS